MTKVSKNVRDTFMGSLNLSTGCRRDWDVFFKSEKTPYFLARAGAGADNFYFNLQSCPSLRTIFVASKKMLTEMAFPVPSPIRFWKPWWAPLYFSSDF